MNAPRPQPPQSRRQTSSNKGTPWGKILGCGAVAVVLGMLMLCFGVAVIKVFVLEDEPTESDALAIDGDEAELEAYEKEAEKRSAEIVDWMANGDVDRIMALFPRHAMTDMNKRNTREFLQKQKYIVSDEQWETEAGRVYTEDARIQDGLEFAFETDGGPVMYKVTKVASRPDDPRTLTLVFEWGVLETSSGQDELTLIRLDATRHTSHRVDTSGAKSEAVERAKSAEIKKNGWAPYDKRAEPDLEEALAFFEDYIAHLRAGRVDKAYAMTHPAFQKMLPRSKYTSAIESVTRAVGGPKSLKVDSISGKPAATRHIWKDNTRVPVTIKAIFVQADAKDKKQKVELAVQQRFDFRETPPSPVGELKLVGQVVHHLN